MEHEELALSGHSLSSRERRALKQLLFREEEGKAACLFDLLQQAFFLFSKAKTLNTFGPHFDPIVWFSSDRFLSPLKRTEYAVFKMSVCRNRFGKGQTSIDLYLRACGIFCFDNFSSPIFLSANVHGITIDDICRHEFNLPDS